MSTLSSESIEKGLLPPNKTAVLPDYIKSCMARYDEFRRVCSIRECRSTVAETY